MGTHCRYRTLTGPLSARRDAISGLGGSDADLSNDCHYYYLYVLSLCYRKTHEFSTSDKKEETYVHHCQMQFYDGTSHFLAEHERLSLLGSRSGFNARRSTRVIGNHAACSEFFRLCSCGCCMRERCSAYFRRSSGYFQVAGARAAGSTASLPAVQPCLA